MWDNREFESLEQKLQTPILAQHATIVMEVECRSLSGDSWCVLLPGATVADLRASISSNAKLYAEGQVLDDDCQELPLPESGERLVVHVAPSISIDSLGSLDVSILLSSQEDLNNLPESPPKQQSPPTLVPMKNAQEYNNTGFANNIVALMIMALVIIGSGVSWLVMTQRVDLPALSNHDQAFAISRDHQLLPANKNLSMKVTEQPWSAEPARLALLRVTAWSQDLGTQEPMLPMMSQVAGNQIARRLEHRKDSQSAPLSATPRWQVMLLPVLTGIVAVVQPIGRRIVVAAMVMARRLLPERR